ncbi:hypothetical protein QJS04_geneDACA001221 [Acorus gramineus]|uniref:Uncharacterized protein n=1 Tax=Acorus gramineus TaxID=55184 RepID=A0AAV9AEM8_ACOGR|nr:hypothetical protein QJS04_geneDACA001221 [Acorus gramineus]
MYMYAYIFYSDLTTETHEALSVKDFEDLCKIFKDLVQLVRLETENEFYHFI